MQNRLGNLIRPPSKKSCYHQGFFAVKRRAVFILGAMWWALVRGWRRDCVVGGMGTRFQWRKAHSRTAKCEAFHIAPRPFFMFLFFIPFTIRQQSIIYPHKFSTDPIPAYTHQISNGISLRLLRDYGKKNGVANCGRHPINWELWVLIMFGEN